MSGVSVATGYEAHRDLLWMCDRWYDLRARLRPDGGSVGTGARTMPASRPPINIHISDLLHEIETEARTLALELLDEAPDWTPTTSAMPVLLREIAHRYGHFTTGTGLYGDKRALDFCDWVHEYRGKVERALERPTSPDYMGDCPEGTCTGDLYLRPGRTSMRCQECGTVTDAATQKAFIESQLRQRLMTQSEITSALVLLDMAVPFSTVRRWASGKRPRLVEVADGLYRLADAIDLAATRRRVA